MAGPSPSQSRRRRSGEAELAAWTARRFAAAAPGGAAASSRHRRSANLTAVRAYVTRFEVANGVSAANWVDAFADPTGGGAAVAETDDYAILAGLYTLLERIAD